MSIAAIGNGLYVRTRPQREARRPLRDYTAQLKRDARGKFAAKVDPTSPGEPKSATHAARLRKATALLILLLRAKLDAGLIQLMREAEWHQVAQVARVRVPSRETREAVLDMMRAIETPLTGAIQ